MKLNSDFAGADEIGSRRELKAVIVYDNALTYRRALSTMISLCREMGTPPNFHYQAWHVDLLGDAVTRRLATNNALESHLVLYSASSPHKEIPKRVQTWLCECVGDRSGDQFVVAALFFEGTETESAIPFTYILNLTGDGNSEWLTPKPRWKF
jgi:hypothetical protein